MAAVLLVGSLAMAQAADELVIASFQDGCLSWTNVNSNLYYTEPFAKLPQERSGRSPTLQKTEKTACFQHWRDDLRVVRGSYAKGSTVEYKPNLADTNIVWDGSYRATQDLKSSATNITVAGRRLLSGGGQFESAAYPSVLGHHDGGECGIL